MDPFELDTIYRITLLNCLFQSSFLFYAEFNSRLFLKLLFTKADIYSAVDLDTLPAIRLVSFLKRKPCVYDAHEYFPESPELKGRSFVRACWSFLERWLVPTVDSAYTVSASIREIFLEKYNKEFRLVRNVPLTSYPERMNNGSSYIIYQGALNVGRGLEEVIDIANRLPCELWLVGEGDISDELKAKAKSSAPNKVRFLGRKTPLELRSLTANAIMGLNLLRPMGLSYELSLANKFFDYIMAEIPQVCIAFEEYVRFNDEFEVASLLKDLEESTLATAILDLLNDADRRSAMIEQCRKAKQHYNWEREESSLLELYRDLG